MAEKVHLPADFYDLSLAERRALFFNEVLEKHLPVQLLEGELIVGSHFNTALSKTLNRKEMKGYLRETYGWVDRLVETHERGIGNAGAVPGHLIPNYRRILQKGFVGIVADIEERLAEESDPEKRAYLRALRLSAEAPRILAERYRKVVEAALEETEDGERKKELARMSEIVARVPYEKPRTFWEALQALWLTHMLVMAAESYPGAGLSHGRIDYYLYPFYINDLEKGVLTREFARELLQCFWIKHNYAYDYQGRTARNQGVNSGFGQLITLGGCGPDGEDLTNELTLLMLEVIDEMNLLEPKPNIRIHQHSSGELLQRIAEMVKKSQGAPFILNFDELSMEALVYQGVPADEVWDYAPVGCLENTMQGNDRSGTVDVNLNLAKAVELALNDGRDMQSGRQIGPRTGDPLTFKSAKEFDAAFYRQLDFILGQVVDLAREADRIRAQYDPIPYLSLMVDGCIEQAVDVNRGGSRYRYITIEGVALATAADSVSAVRKLVFEEGTVTMERLLAALRNDFAGDEELRQILINRAPKYGNDDPFADGTAREISRWWTEKAMT